MSKQTIAVLFGGMSGEHEISLQSAASVLKALRRDRYEIIELGIARDGRFFVGKSGASVLAALSQGRLDELVSVTIPPAARAIMPTVAGLSPIPVDAAFPVLHGPMGEDGTVQGLLELALVPYVGCGVAASAVCMDKALAKELFRQAGLPVLPHVDLTRRAIGDNPDGIAARIQEALTWPVFVKPCRLGSSVGVSKVTQESELEAALSLAATHDPHVIVERGVDAREIEVSILGNEEPRASVPGEIVPGADFYDYQAKYLDDSSRLLIPAPLADDQARTIQEMAVRAFTAVRGSGMARVDFLLDRLDGRIYLNEINTIPGFTKISMYPKLWQATGVDYPDLLDELIRLALEKESGLGPRPRKTTPI